MSTSDDTSSADLSSDPGVEDGLVISYLTLRKAVGALGVLLPVVLALGCDLLDPCKCLEGSISQYYGTVMRDVLVGVLFAIGFFLFSYKGFGEKDDRAGNLACGFAVGVALFPTTSEVKWIHWAHYVFATGLFLTFSYFSLVLFTKMGPLPPTDQKKKRNKVYVACGIVMLACILLIPLSQAVLSDAILGTLKPVFWLESLALWAFGVSWMTKGEVILKDD